MDIKALQKTYEALTVEQQLVVYNLAVSLRNLNIKKDELNLSNPSYSVSHSSENLSLFDKKYS